MSDGRGLDGPHAKAGSHNGLATLHWRTGRTLDSAMGQRDLLDKRDRYEGHIAQKWSGRCCYRGG